MPPSTAALPALTDAPPYANHSNIQDESSSLTQEESVQDSKGSDEEWAGDSTAKSTLLKKLEKRSRIHPEKIAKSQIPATSTIVSVALDTIESRPTMERIIEVALMPPLMRHKELSDCFYSNGATKDRWRQLFGTEIRQARSEQNKAKAEQNPQKRVNRRGKTLSDLSQDDEVHELQESEINAQGNKVTQFPVKPFLSSSKAQRESLRELSPSLPIRLSFSSPFAATEVLDLPSSQDGGVKLLEAPDISPTTPDQVDTRAPHQYKSQTPSRASNPSAANEGVFGRIRDPSTPRVSIKIKATSNTIICSMVGCKLSPFHGKKLLIHGIKIENVREALRQNDCWFCHDCVVRVQAVGKSNPQISKPIVSPVQRVAKLSTKFGDSFLDDSDVRGPLLDLTGLVEQYTANACTQPAKPIPCLPILSLPCIKNEQAGSEKLVVVLRKMLGVSAGIPIAEAIRHLGLEDDQAFWVNSVLVFVIEEFVFKNGTPFEDRRLWKETLRYTDLPGPTAASIIQDNRIRTMKASPHPAQFARRLQTRHDKFVEDLNAIMLPLVGFSFIIDETHKAIATAAQELNLLITAYTSEYQSISPKMGDKFNKREHSLYGLVSHKDEGKSILLTKMLGLKVAIPDGNWRICHMAEVGLLPDAANASAQASVIPQKRHYEEID